MHAVLGLFFFPFLAWVFRESRGKDYDLSLKKIAKMWMVVVGLQFLIAAAFQFLPGLTHLMSGLNYVIAILDEVTAEATQFMFGYLAGGQAPFEIVNEGKNFVTAFRVFPLIITVGVLGTILYHCGILPAIIRVFSKLLRKTLGVSGTLSVGAAGSLYFGTIECLILIRPYIASMSRSDLFALVCCSLATLAGSVMILYATVLNGVIAEPLSHIVIASMISIPAALMMASLIVPESSDVDDEEAKLPAVNITLIEAILKSVRDGVRMIADIVAIIIALFALIYLINRGIGAILPGTSLQDLLSYLMRPLLWLTGLSWEESIVAAPLMGTKVILNEFVAYVQLKQLPAGSLSEIAEITVLYAMGGFANLASLGIILGGLGPILGERRTELAHLAPRALLVGNLATLMTASVIHVLLSIRSF